MASDGPTLSEWLDSQIGGVISGWDLYTTVLCLVLVTYFLYPFFFPTEPDTHPFLIARQSTASRVRQPGESAVYRPLDTPHSYPLRTGLNVKDPDAPKWSSGRDGDLRDVWRRAAVGKLENNGKVNGQVGKVFTVLGKEDVLEATFKKLSSELNAIGKHLTVHGGSRIAIYLSNSPELLVSLFASLFYSTTPILISQEQSLYALARILKETNANTLIVGAGSVPLNDLVKQYDGLKEVIWVVPKSSRHVDWNEVPEGAGGKAEVATWHDIVDEEGSFAPSDLPPNDAGSPASVLLVTSPPTERLDYYEVTEYTQKNLTAAISAQLAVLPQAHRISSSDLLLPLISLTDIYSLTVTLVALFSNASVALTPVTGRSAKYTSAFNSQPQISPTIIIAYPSTLESYESSYRSKLSSNYLRQLQHNHLVSSVKSTGAMVSRSSASVPKGEDTVRLIYTPGATYPGTVSNLRIFTGARIIVALTDPKVAGAITQTHMLDYTASEKKDAHFGPPLSCLEIKLKEIPGHSVEDTTDAAPEGLLAISGPAVVGPPGTTVTTNYVAKINNSGTVSVLRGNSQKDWNQKQHDQFVETTKKITEIKPEDAKS